MFKELAEMAVNCGGTIFGGYVRDFIRHEECSKEFFKHNKLEDFSNSDVSPETIDRLLLPSDLDIHFENNMDYRKFRADMRAAFYLPAVKGISNMYTDGPRVHHIKVDAVLHIDPGRVMRGLKIRSVMAKEIIKPAILERISSMSIETTPISMDILITSDKPPFSKLDFRCNGLVLNKDGISLCDDLKNGLGPLGVHRTLMNVFDDIKNKRAVVENLKSTRWDKMEAKGWDLVGASVEKVKKVGEECLICLQDIDPDGVHKLQCCNAYYHFDCLSRQITYPTRGIVDSGKCTHCRQPIYISPDEVQMFGAVINNF